MATENPTELSELRGILQSHKGLDKNLKTFTSVILLGGQAEDGTVSKLKLQIHKNIHKRDKNKNKTNEKTFRLVIAKYLILV